MTNKFKYKNELAEELGKTKEKLSKYERDAKFIKNQEMILRVEEASQFLLSQPFAKNFNDNPLIYDLRCYRADETGYWFTYRHLTSPKTIETFNVRHSDLSDEKTSK